MLKILRVVGCDFYNTGGDKAAEKMFEIGGGDKSSFVVALFRPGVGEIDVETFDRTIGDEIDYKVRGVGSDYADIFELPPADAVDGVAVVFYRPLDAEEIDVGLGSGLVEEEGGFAGSDFDMDGIFSSENPRKIDFALQIFGL